ncbi:mitogen-activated protein kinase kinase kinase 20-like [Carya illinoinensis]|uniref:Protein kinase domain-containing protein n=1 Tax=Carya illinoinensis TaxID=32201 RepID=A0A8T1RIS0_CARIL|nr:mitogen-activated protein kinase kinase kinase 20-like [Carya illinoinensis]KAG6666798.1 hypothetical protein CIPAW_01G057200 [Carya illinoinensis]
MGSTFGDGESWVRGPLIGKGGFGSVFLATLKKPKPRFVCFPSTMAVKSAEVSVSGSLQKEKEVLDNVKGSPYVINCLGEEITTPEKGEMVYNLLLEYASGGTLADSIEKSHGCRLPETDVKRYTWSILKGLGHIHDRGFVHCDLKPENVLLVPTIGPGGNFVAKIGDFGLAKRSAQKKKRRMDLDFYLRGTPLYMAPEAVIENVQKPPCDIWALGCLVCEMLTGKSPWDREEELNAEELLQLIGDEREVPKIPNGVSDEAKSFLKSCLVRKPIYRFTAEMLMDHPFLTGIGYQLEDEYMKKEEHEVASPSVSCNETDSEFSGSSICSSFSVDDDDDSTLSKLSSWPEDGENSEVQKSDKKPFAASLNTLPSTILLRV